MAGRLSLARGSVWLASLKPPGKRRPVLVLTRPALIDVLSAVVVAPITSTIRDAPTEVRLGVDDGMKSPCAVNLTRLYTLRKDSLARYVTTLPEARMREICAALGISLGCSL
jgi:mRNA interferase MazF